MARIVKWLVGLSAVLGALTVMSYAGARVAAGKVVGPHRALSGRTIELAWKGAPELRGRPRAWVFTYVSSQMPGVSWARIYVSPTGKVLATTPHDLAERVYSWELKRLP